MYLDHAEKCKLRQLLTIFFNSASGALIKKNTVKLLAAKKNTQ